MSATSPNDPERNYEIPVIFLPEIVFDASEGQAGAEAAVCGFEHCDVLLPTIDLNTGQPVAEPIASQPLTNLTQHLGTGAFGEVWQARAPEDRIVALKFLDGDHSCRRFSVEEYHRLIEAGILTELDRVELLEGFVVQQPPRNPPHDGSIDLVHGAVRQALPQGWRIRIRSGVTLPDSEPEPDLAIVRGTDRTYSAHHPMAADIGLIIEVADSSLPRDRDEKGRIYARAGIACYWIVNLQDQQVEVYSSPSGPTTKPAYGQRQDCRAGDAIPLHLDGVVIAQVPVSDLML